MVQTLCTSIFKKTAVEDAPGRCGSVVTGNELVDFSTHRQIGRERDMEEDIEGERGTGRKIEREREIISGRESRRESS